MANQTLRDRMTAAFTLIMGIDDAGKPLPWLDDEVNYPYQVAFLLQVEQRAAAEKDRAVILAREAGYTWDEIAVALGVSRSAAIQKYRGSITTDVDLRRR